MRFLAFPRWHSLGIAMAVTCAIALAAPASAQNPQKREERIGAMGCADFPGAPGCGGAGDPSRAGTDGEGPCDMFRGFSGCPDSLPPRQTAAGAERSSRRGGTPDGMFERPPSAVRGIPPRSQFEGDLGGPPPPPRRMVRTMPRDDMGGALSDPGLGSADPGMGMPMVMGAQPSMLDSPVFLHPSVPEDKREAVQAAYLQYMQGRLATMQALSVARTALSETLSRFPIDADVARTETDAVAQAWSAEMRSRAAYAAELQGILGEDTWNALMDGHTDSGGAGSAGGGGQMMR